MSAGQIVPALDLVGGHGLGQDPRDVDDAPRVAPHNIEAEQALLGVLLYDNAPFERLHDGFLASYFFEPFHGRLFEALATHIRKGQLAEPILLSDEFKQDPAFHELGGIRYLADLVDRAPPAANMTDYARAIEELAIRRKLITISGDIAKLAHDGKDEDLEPVGARDQIEQAEQKLYGLAETGGRNEGLMSFKHYLAGAVDSVAAAYQRDGQLSGISTGLTGLDQKLGGLHPSDLLVLAGRPSMGKTSLATNIAFNVSSRYTFQLQPDGTTKTLTGGRVAFYSLEMSGEQLALRILADASGVSGHKLRTGDIEAHEFGRVRDAAMLIQESPLLIDATGAISVGKLAARARRAKRQGGLDLIVIDYIQLMTSGHKTNNRVEEVSAITAALKALAKELDVPIIALSQLSREVEKRDDKRPQLSDLRESGSIEQDSDAVLFVYRESYYLSRAEPKEGTAEHLKWQEDMDRARGVAEVIIGKQRHGPIGTVRLSFHDDTTRFGNLAVEKDYAAARLPYAEGEA